MLDQVYDLRELGSRPYNLRLIQDQVEALEAIQREGGRIGVADLYDGMVGQWVLRDAPKHRLNRDHKLLLMERLALWLWSKQKGDLSYADLNDWLIGQILSEPRWERIEYHSYMSRDEGPEILKEDLRNASFIVREGDDRFRFAHTSIMEFFLARALHRALVQNRLDDWAIPIPSPETLDFLGGLIAGSETEACLAGLGRIRGVYRAQVSELVLAYALRAYDLDLPGGDFSGFQFEGVELRFQRWQGRQDRPMDWRGARLSGARLDGGRFTDCDFTDSRFDGADLARCLIERARLDRVSAQRVDLTGTTIRDCPAVGADFGHARLYHTQWLGDLPAGMDPQPPALFAATRDLAPAAAEPGNVVGHSSQVNCVAIYSAGRCVASGGSDGSVRIWDRVSGRLLHALEGHECWVRALAAAPDGHWLASGGDDGRVLIWDPAIGRVLHVLEEHGGRVSALAAAPDGQWLASGGNDGRVRIWDPASGRLLHALEGHRNSVGALVPALDGRWLASAGGDGRVLIWAPASWRLLGALGWLEASASALATAADGRWLASAGEDGRVRIWEAACGRLLHDLSGHRGRVRALTATPDGRWLASASDDRKVRIWDPVSGRLLHALDGHGDWVRALAAAPNGRWLASAGDQGRVRLWDPASGRLLYALDGHGSPVRTKAAVPDARWPASVSNDGRVRIRALPQSEDAPVCKTVIEHLPESNWVVWQDPDGPNRRWVRWSRDAWRWLGWHAPLPDGKHWMYYPMDAFRAAPEPDAS